MPRPAIAELPTSAIVEVESFLEQRKALDAWKKRNAKALAELAKILTAYNPVLRAAETAVKERRVSCGPFVLKHFSADRDASALLELLGREDFERRGGTIKPTKLVMMETERFDGAVALLPPADEAKVVAYTPVYDKPKLLVLP